MKFGRTCFRGGSPAGAGLHFEVPGCDGVVSFQRSNAGWLAIIALPEPVIAVAWRFGETGPWLETGLLDVIDQQTGRPAPNLHIPFDAATPAGVLHVRSDNAAGATHGPFGTRFAPADALVLQFRRTLELLADAWVVFREFDGLPRYFTTLATYRLAIAELRIGIDDPEPGRVIALPPSDVRDPFSIPHDYDVTVSVPMRTRLVSVQLVFHDGAVSPARQFWR